MKKFLLPTVLFITIILIVTGIGFLLIRRDIAFSISQTIASAFRSSDLEKQDIETFAKSIDEIDHFDLSKLLINRDHPLPEPYITDLCEYKGKMISCLMKENLEALTRDIFDRCSSTLHIRSAYRTQEDQEKLVATLPSDIAAPLGTSEHQGGLALDVFIDQTPGGAILQTQAGRYLHTHCHEYGFILRYPRGKSDITGITYEPWHIRYVGIPHAEIIYSENLTYEEYLLDFLEINVYYEIDCYYISRQIPENGFISLPKTYTSIEIAPDNCGGYLITARQ